MGANHVAKSLYSLIIDAVKHRITIAALGKYPCLVEHLQLLRHIGLGRAGSGHKFAHSLLAVAKAVNDFEPHGCRQHREQFGCFLEHMLRSIQDASPLLRLARLSQFEGKQPVTIALADQ